MKQMAVWYYNEAKSVSFHVNCNSVFPNSIYLNSNEVF